MRLGMYPRVWKEFGIEDEVCIGCEADVVDRSVGFRGVYCMEARWSYVASWKMKAGRMEVEIFEDQIIILGIFTDQGRGA